MYFLMIILVVSVLSGCSVKEKETVQKKSDKEEIQIGMSFDSFVIERWNKDKSVFVSKAVSYGAKVNVQNANGELGKQIEQIRYLIKKNMDVIVIIAVDSNGLSDVVAEAKQAGIKVIAYDRLINNAEIDLYISFDNSKVGVLMADALINATGGKGSYLMLTGPTTDNNVKMIEEGFRKTIVNRKISIADTMHAENWRAEYVYEYLRSHNGIVEAANGIMCGNDNLATQTIRYLSEVGLAGKIPVVGQDADLEACQHIVEGTQLMTVYKPVEQLASKAAECAVMLAQGDIGISLSNRVMSNGRYSCPYISLEPVAVDNVNMNDVIIKDGFHLREEVYLNVSGK